MNIFKRLLLLCLLFCSTFTFAQSSYQLVMLKSNGCGNCVLYKRYFESNENLNVFIHDFQWKSDDYKNLKMYFGVYSAPHFLLINDEYFNLFESGNYDQIPSDAWGTINTIASAEKVVGKLGKPYFLNDELLERAEYIQGELPSVKELREK